MLGACNFTSADGVKYRCSCGNTTSHPNSIIFPCPLTPTEQHKEFKDYLYNLARSGAEHLAKVIEARIHRVADASLKTMQVQIPDIPVNEGDYKPTAPSEAPGSLPAASKKPCNCSKTRDLKAGRVS
jgi:hypothetical protein